jgi:hypothetical protein
MSVRGAVFPSRCFETGDEDDGEPDPDVGDNTIAGSRFPFVVVEEEACELEPCLSRLNVPLVELLIASNTLSPQPLSSSKLNPNPSPSPPDPGIWLRLVALLPSLE